MSGGNGRFNPFQENQAEWYLVVGGVPCSKVEDCINWAFGKLHTQDTLIDMMNKWNKRHSDIFYLTKKDL